MEDFVDTYTPEGNMRGYGDWKNAVKTNINQARVGIIGYSFIVRTHYQHACLVNGIQICVDRLIGR